MMLAFFMVMSIDVLLYNMVNWGVVGGCVRVGGNSDSVGGGVADVGAGVGGCR